MLKQMFLAHFEPILTQFFLHCVKESSSALQLHDMSEKRPKKAPKSPKNLRNVHQHPETKHGPYLGLRGSNPNSEGPQPPTFCGFQASESPNEPPRPPY